MDHVFSVTRKLPNNNSNFIEWLQESNPISSISSRNVIAFTSSTALHESDPKSWKINIYVADLNVAFEPHRVTTHHEEITSLEWDFTGSKLMVGDAMGNVEIWGIKDYMLSDWIQLSSHSAFAGEKVLEARWFHNGIKWSIVPETSEPMTLYSEKYIQTKFSPTVRNFGGRPSEGCVAISCTGLIWVMVIQPDGSCLLGTEILGKFRSRIRAIDVCYTKNGQLFVVTSSGSVESPINSFHISVKVSTFSNQEKGKCTVTCIPYSSFFLNATKNNLLRENNVSITHLRLVNRESSDSVIIATCGESGSIVEIWEIVEMPIEVHKVFQKKPKSPEQSTDPEKVVVKEEVKDEAESHVVKTSTVWQHHASHSSPSPVLTMVTPRFSLYDPSSTQSYIVVAYQDNMIKCILKDQLQEVCKLGHPLLAPSKSSEGQSKFGQKMQPFSPHSSVNSICSIQFTWTGSALVALDSVSQMFVYRVAAATEVSNIFMSPQYAKTIMEYCMITGYDAWDLILGLQSNALEPTFELLTNSFNRQPPNVQAKFVNRFNQLKGFIYRTLPAKSTSSLGQVKAGDAHATLMLTAVSTFLKFLLRARDNQEKEGPAESLSSLIPNKAKEVWNVDKVMMELKHKEFFVETSALPSIQNLNQWVADLTLYLLASLPSQIHSHYKFPGASLINDAKSINLLRELIVVIRIWGLINDLCLPVVTRLSGDDRFDIIAHLFKLLTKRLNTLNNPEPDEGLLDECTMLPNQVLITQLDFSLKSRGIASPTLYANVQPFNCIYFTEPSFLKFNIKTHTVEGAVICNSSQRMDAVRHVVLGPINVDSSFSKVRMCTRCQATSLAPCATASAPRLQLTSRSWDLRFSKTCPCSGMWS